MKLTIYPENRVLVEGGLYEYLEHAKRPPIYPFANAQNQTEYEKLIRDANRIEFAGGTYEELFCMPDMKPFAKAKEKLQDSQLSKRLISKFSNLNRRRRILTEYDGEWDISRQWEIQPFSNAKRQQTPHKIIDIDCHINVSCMVTAEQINEFGCFVWAINDVIESCGINTNINLISEAQGPDVTRAVQLRTIVTVKKAGEYIDPSNIAKCLTSNFLRRVLFSWFVIGCDFAGTLACSSLGRPCQMADIIKFENGRLLISSETIRNPNDKNVQDELVKAIIGDKK